MNDNQALGFMMFVMIGAFASLIITAPKNGVQFERYGDISFITGLCSFITLDVINKKSGIFVFLAIIAAICFNSLTIISLHMLNATLATTVVYFMFAYSFLNLGMSLS
jgi:hypothetical protein